VTGSVVGELIISTLSRRSTFSEAARRQSPAYTFHIHQSAARGLRVGQPVGVLHDVSNWQLA
jgi:hypothetical protein